MVEIVTKHHITVKLSLWFSTRHIYIIFCLAQETNGCLIFEVPRSQLLDTRTHSRSPLEERSVRPAGRYLHKTQGPIFIFSAGFEPDRRRRKASYLRLRTNGHRDPLTGMLTDQINPKLADRLRWMVSFRLSPIYHLYQLNRKLGGFRSVSGCCGSVCLSDWGRRVDWVYIILIQLILHFIYYIIFNIYKFIVFKYILQCMLL
jgi:hypothetical protein